MEKKYPITGADNKTPSIPYYFSWVNSSNEGSNERQTIVNLDFFGYMKEKYGMQIEIYAWDAGNFDGASGGYGDLSSEKFKSQYPNGYKPVVERAKELGIRMGLWGSPDGYGDDPETERERFEFYVHLCRDYNFAAFKMDGVCGFLRPEKAHKFAEMLEECRKYSPDLIILNHRLEMYEAQKYITTFLWNGEETYTDVFARNRVTAPHNRAYLFRRGHVFDENGNLTRLAEDHGVCLSSCLDFFEDELIYQGFGRCLITAPETYGNPWLLKDSELPKLARVYNLHRRYRNILVDGVLLPENYGACAISRGSDSHRFICTGNDTWETKKVRIKLDEEIGLKDADKVKVVMRHPFDCVVGEYSYGDTAEIEMLPFRAYLIEISDNCGPVLTGAKYEVIREDEKGNPLEIALISGKVDDESIKVTTRSEEKAPVFLGSLEDEEDPAENGEKIYETALFAVDNDSLELQCLKRSGKTEIPEVQAARDEFFGQETYVKRGCDNGAMFDGDPDTFFDGQSRMFWGWSLRWFGGCLRIDLGETVDADCIEFVSFKGNEAVEEVPEQIIPESFDYSVDLKNWKESGKVQFVGEEDYRERIIKMREHISFDLDGKKTCHRYPISDKIRYLRMADPMSRIYSVKLYKNGEEIKPEKPVANNLMAHYKKRPTAKLVSGKVKIPAYNKGDYLAVALEGNHGEEGAYCTFEIDGKLYGATGRAPTFPVNPWEFCVGICSENSTYYFTLPEGMEGKEIKIYTSFMNKDATNVRCDVRLCTKHE